MSVCGEGCLGNARRLVSLCLAEEITQVTQQQGRVGTNMEPREQVLKFLLLQIFRTFRSTLEMEMSHFVLLGF